MDGLTSASAEGADNHASVRPKRSRTGCMTCRNRRRKCDEGKPVCQNCKSKGFDCVYAAAFQILGKHNFTPVVKTDVQYARVHFAGDEPNESVAKATQPVSSTHNLSSDRSAQPRAADFSSKRAGQLLAKTNPLVVTSHTPSPDSYEFALHGLIALGSASKTNQGTDIAPAPAISENQEVSTFDFVRSNDEIPSSHDVGLQWRPEVYRTGSEYPSTLSFGSVLPGTPDPSNFHNSQEPLSADATVPSTDSPADTVAAGHRTELLKFFRYNIAPWLDICDADQHFGVELLTESRHVQSLRSCVMRVAAASTSTTWLAEGLSTDMSVSSEVAYEGVGLSIDMEGIIGVLEILTDMMPNPAAWWSQQDIGDRRPLVMERLLLELGVSILHASAYWLSVRLELSHALMGGAHRIPLPLLNEQFGVHKAEELMAQRAYDAIALCVDSAMFAQGDDDRWLQQRYGLNRVEIWKALIQGFAHWYMHRSQAFQPIIELYPKDGVLSDDDYPTIVFTSGAALLANQLYHTGMLLLLQNKPRFADKPSQSSSSMSVLWHVHRICGIAIQNDRPGWWDPCLVASLIIAGRTATHASQHNAILHTLQFVQRLTGWTLDPCVDQLTNEWRLADSW